MNTTDPPDHLQRAAREEVLSGEGAPVAGAGPQVEGVHHGHVVAVQTLREPLPGGVRLLLRALWRGDTARSGVTLLPALL